VDESPCEDDLGPPIDDQRAAPEPPEKDAIVAISNVPAFKEAALVVLASPLHSHAQKAWYLQTFASAKFPDQPLGITAAHVPCLMEQYREEDYQPLFAAVSRSRGLSEQLVHWLHNFMDRECLYGETAIDLCSGWGRNKLYLLGQHYRYVDVMDQDSAALERGEEYADLMGLI
jgi:hypothetical protein